MLNWYVVSCDENNTLQDMTKTRGGGLMGIEELIHSVQGTKDYGLFHFEGIGGFSDGHKTDI